MTQLTMEDIIKTLNLVPLSEEGGLVAETYQSEETYENRKVGSAIYYFLTENSFSHLHKLSADEMWHFYYGDPVEIIQIDDATGEKSWQGARIIPGGKMGFTLMGTTMSPSYMDNDFIFGSREEMIKKFPEHAEDIEKVTGELVYK